VLRPPHLTRSGSAVPATPTLALPPPQTYPPHARPSPLAQPSQEAVAKAQEAEEHWPASRAALALWILFKPSFTASGALAGALEGMGAAELTSDGRIKGKPCLTIKQAYTMQQAHPGMVEVVPQHAGAQVFVPPGWAHQVINLKPCIKVAWERCRRAWYFIYMLHALTVVPKFEKMASDYIGLQQLVFRELVFMRLRAS
jgi:hypothetical protein